MRTCINIEDINLLCDVPQSAGSYSSKTWTECNEQNNQQNEAEHRCSRWMVFKEKAKNIWGKVKRVVSEVTDVLNTATSFVRATTGFVKCFRKMRGLFA